MAPAKNKKKTIAPARPNRSAASAAAGGGAQSGDGIPAGLASRPGKDIPAGLARHSAKNIGADLPERGPATGLAPDSGEADDVPQWAARALQQLLTVTYWLDPGDSGEPFSATIRFIGHRTDLTGLSRPGDTFSQEESVEKIVPGSGPVAVTAEVRGINQGTWAGCCTGRPTASRWGIWSSDRRLGCRRMPVQLFEAWTALAVGAGALIVVLLTSLHRSGPIAVAGLAAYTLIRQLILGLRDEPRAWRYGRPVTATAAALTLIAGIALFAAVG